jgi:hypothetical protein
MNYNKNINGTTEGKIVSRNQITEYFKKVMRSSGRLTTLTLPSNVGIQEREIHKEFTNGGEHFTMTCIESDSDIYNSFVDEFKLGKGMVYFNETLV